MRTAHRPSSNSTSDGAAYARTAPTVRARSSGSSAAGTSTAEVPAGSSAVSSDGRREQRARALGRPPRARRRARSLPGAGATSTTGARRPAAASSAAVTASSGATSNAVGEQAPAAVLRHRAHRHRQRTGEQRDRGLRRGDRQRRGDPGDRRVELDSDAVGARLEPLVAFAGDLGPAAEQRRQPDRQQGDARDERDHPHQPHGRVIGTGRPDQQASPMTIRATVTASAISNCDGHRRRRLVSRRCRPAWRRA